MTSTDQQPVRLVTYGHQGSERMSVGVLFDDELIVDIPTLSRAHGVEMPDNMVDLLQRDDAVPFLRRAIGDRGSIPDEAAQPRARCRLMAPVPVPGSIRDVPIFLAHVQAGMAAIGMKPSAAIGTIPAYYKGNPRTVIGTDDEVVAPSYADTVDFEMEIGIYIKREGKNIPIDEAATYIGGYTIFNDASARARQSEEMAIGLGPAKGKDFDTGNVMGPCLVPDLDLDAVRYAVRVNGEEWASGTLSERNWSVEEVISYISTSETLYAGDFMGLGTVPGGCGLELGRYPKLGDIVEFELDPIGVLRCAYARQRDPGVAGGAAVREGVGR